MPLEHALFVAGLLLAFVLGVVVGMALLGFLVLGRLGLALGEVMGEALVADRSPRDGDEPLAPTALRRRLVERRN